MPVIQHLPNFRRPWGLETTRQNPLQTVGCKLTRLLSYCAYGSRRDDTSRGQRNMATDIFVHAAATGSAE